MDKKRKQSEAQTRNQPLTPATNVVQNSESDEGNKPAAKVMKESSAVAADSALA